MPKAPKSYLNRKRWPILEAIALEGDVTIERATELLKKKGYFTPHSGPWHVGFHDRGHGHGDYAVLDYFGDLVCKATSKENAEFIVTACNEFRKNRRR